MRYPKLRELGEAVKSLFSPPATTKFPFKPHEPPDGYRGKPEYFDEYCVGCGACSLVCPGNAINMLDPEEPVTQLTPAPKRKMQVRYDMCNFCGNCEAHCITEKGIQLTKTFDLALFDRKLAVDEVEKELIICELCGGIVTTRDHSGRGFFVPGKVWPLASEGRLRGMAIPAADSMGWPFVIASG